jgi:hypothetical protein
MSSPLSPIRAATSCNLYFRSAAALRPTGNLELLRSPAFPSSSRSMSRRQSAVDHKREQGSEGGGEHR